jgi:hypothetical protein
MPRSYEHFYHDHDGEAWQTAEHRAANEAWRAETEALAESERTRGPGLTGERETSWADLQAAVLQALSVFAHSGQTAWMGEDLAALRRQMAALAEDVRRLTAETERATLALPSAQPSNVQEFVAAHGLRGALESLTDIVATLTPSRATVRLSLDTFRESATQQLVASIVYRRDALSREELNAILERYSNEVSADAQQYITLLKLPIDGDDAARHP